MKISMMSYTMYKGNWKDNFSVERLCQFTKNIGLDGIDWVTTYGNKPQEIKKIMDDYCLKTVCFTFFVDINFKEKSLRQKGIEEIKRGLEIASILGTDKIMLPIGGKVEYTKEESRKNVIEGLKEVIKESEKYNINITVEHFPDIKGPFLTSEDINFAIKEIPELRITFDSGNVILGCEKPEDAFINNQKYIIHCHFKDWIFSEQGKEGLDGKKYKPALVGEGIIDYRKLIKIMKESKYDSYINLEYEGNEYEPDVAMEKGLKFLKSILEEEENEK
ncbi:MAG: sugar phosphate isomerase/epimerase [Candidatus Omnitrophica bacterium]|nr:sugar phosphate isomerase/epimerase [Candidatus Omnitrophota bacterium]MCM8802552.1 sugar phosphate isomerase/epimerase [Candidatus Omnitrophota bacterium]